MDSIPGDKWIGEYARWLQIHEAQLGDVAASAAAAKRNASRANPAASASTLSSTFWNVVSLGTANTASAAPEPVRSPSKPASSSASSAAALAARPMLLRQNPHNVYYLLIRFEALGLAVGSLDTKVPVSARPTSYFSFVAANASSNDRDDTMSISSMRSRISVVSSSFGSSLSWFGSAPPKPDPSKDLKYIYACFTKIPSLRLGPIPARKLIQDFEDCPGQSAVPLDVFKNLQMLELDDVDPRTLLGWDRLSSQLRSLTCRKSNIEDLTHLLIDLVLLDTRRRRGEKVDPNRLRRAPPNAKTEADLSASASSLPPGVHAENGKAATQQEADAAGSAGSSRGDMASASAEATPSLPKHMPSLAWHFLRYLNLASNNLTFVPAEPLLALAGLTHLDLSSNLLNVVPPALSHLASLRSLNISDNLIDSVLGIYHALPAVRVLNLAHNRLESLCGLERLYALERVDLRANALFDAGEVGRLAPLPAIAEVWVKQNPLVDELLDYRVDCFVEFAREGRSIALDGEPPGFFERQRIAERVPNLATLYAQNSLGESRRTALSENGTGAAAGSSKTSELEENEAQVTQDAATTSRHVTVVKNVRHRAASRPANSPDPRGTSDHLDVPDRPHRRDAQGGAKPSGSRSRSTSRSRLPGGAGNGGGGGGRRRNQRVVELDSSPQKPVASARRERTLTESDRIKQAALSGDTSAAMDGAVLARTASPPRGATASEPDASQSSQRPASNKESALAAQGAMLFALPPGMASSEVAEASSGERVGKPRTLTSRRNPIDSSTLGRKSAARPVASDLFATSDTIARNVGTDGEGIASKPTRVDADPNAAQAAAGAEQESAVALARQRIARPRAGSAAALARRSRVTTSLYEPDLSAAEPVPSAPSGAAPLAGVAEEGDASHPNAKPKRQEATGATAGSLAPDASAEGTGSTGAAGATGRERSDALRRRIEALKSEVGDDWLRLLARGGGTAGERNSVLMLAGANPDEQVRPKRGKKKDVAGAHRRQAHIS